MSNQVNEDQGKCCEGPATSEANECCAEDSNKKNTGQDCCDRDSNPDVTKSSSGTCC